MQVDDQNVYWMDQNKKIDPLRKIFPKKEKKKFNLVPFNNGWIHGYPVHQANNYTTREIQVPNPPITYHVIVQLFLFLLLFLQHV